MSKQPALAAASNESRRKFATALWTATTIVAVVVVSRRLGGHFTNTLHPAAAMLVAGLFTAVNLAAVSLLKSSLTQHFTWHKGWLRFIVGLMTVAPPAAVGLALLPSGSVSGLAALATLAILSVAFIVAAESDVGRLFIISQQSIEQAKTGSLDLERHFDAETAAPSEEDHDLELDEVAENDSQGVSQSMSRTRLGDGSETIEGTIVLPFAAGQQIGVAHLPFSPPFGSQPRVTCHLLDDSPVRLRVTATQTYGARVEAKRTGTAFDADEILIGYVVSAECARDNAA